MAFDKDAMYEIIKDFEAFDSNPYYDDKGLITIGVGFNIQKILLIFALFCLPLFAINKNIIKAHKKSLEVYSQTKDYNKAIDILEKNGIKMILKKRPKHIKKNQYIHILNDYAFFIYQTKNDYHKRSLKKFCLAKSVLERVIKLNPNRMVAYLNLGNVLLELVLRYRYHMTIQLMGNRKFLYKMFNESGCMSGTKVNEKYIYVARDNYKIYYQKMKAKNKLHLVPIKVKKIVESGKYFFVVINHWKYPLYEHKYNSLYENACSDYINLLNQIPDENKTYCNRYNPVNDKNFVIEENQYKVVKKIPCSESDKDEQCVIKELRSFPIKVYYKGNLMLDYKRRVFQANEKNTKRATSNCYYELYDFNNRNSNTIHAYRHCLHKRKIIKEEKSYE